MDRTVPPTEWKPIASAGNRTQVGMPLLSEVSQPAPLEMYVVRQATFNGVLNHACKHSGMEDQEIADAIYISHGYMSRFMRGVGQQWAKRLIAFMRTTKSLGPLQWMADQMGCDLTQRNAISAELAAARARVAELERGGERWAA
jgi:hypothetical protein